jgi:hypothetical protein
MSNIAELQRSKDEAPQKVRTLRIADFMSRAFARVV